MLPSEIQSPHQLLSAALAAEREAVRHYAEMAERMRHYENHEASELFKRLANEGRERESQLTEWAKLEQITLNKSAEPVIWEDPLMPTTYDAEARDPYRSTPYKALAYAAHNTDRIFHFYTFISANAADPQTERYAKILAGDALNRTRLLTSRRRRAYHLEHRGIRQQQLDEALRLKTLVELHAISANLEGRLTNLLTAMTEYYEDLAPIAEQSRKTMERCQQQLIAAGESLTSTDAPYDIENLGTDFQQDILMIFAESERTFNFYDTVMAHAYDEDIMLEAQHLSEAALARLEAIRQLQKKSGIEPTT
jgi:rubrerythrin